MKTSSTVLVSTAGAVALGLVVLLSACSKTHDTNATTAANPPANPPTASANTQPAAPASWDTLKNYSFDQRNEVVTKVNQYADKLDSDAKNAKGPTANRLAQARDELRNAATEATNATATTWQATKDKVGDAWKKAESAYQNAAE